MREISAYALQQRISAFACKMDCEDISLAKKGKASKQNNDDLFEMMFIYEFLPYWNTEQIRQKECYLNNKHGL